MFDSGVTNAGQSPVVQATFTGGALPVTYLWEWVGDTIPAGRVRLFTNPVTASSMRVSVTAPPGTATITYFRVKITDNEGNVSYGPTCEWQYFNESF